MLFNENILHRVYFRQVTFLSQFLFLLSLLRVYGLKSYRTFGGKDPPGTIAELVCRNQIMAVTLKMLVASLVLASTNILVESLFIMVEQVNLSVIYQLIFISAFHRIKQVNVFSSHWCVFQIKLEKHFVISAPKQLLCSYIH